MADPDASTLVERSPTSVVRISVGSELRLRHIPGLLDAIRFALNGQAARIELDVSSVRWVTEGARCLLEVAAHRLRQREVELVVVDASLAAA